MSWIGVQGGCRGEDGLGQLGLSGRWRAAQEVQGASGSALPALPPFFFFLLLRLSAFFLSSATSSSSSACAAHATGSEWPYHHNTMTWMIGRLMRQ